MPKRADQIVFALIFSAVAAFVVLGRAPAATADVSSAVKAGDETAAEPALIAVTFSSAWCSACKILKPRVAEIIPDFADQPVRFVELDFTFGQREDLERKAARHGLDKIYPQYKGATGFTLLVDRDTGEIVDTLTASYSSQAMRASVAAAIAVAEAATPQNP